MQLNEIAKDLIEQIAFEARKSEYVDQKSGVSARMTITALENLVSGAERRSLKSNEAKTFVRVSDFWSVIPSITGKIELVYEGEQEGPYIVAVNLIGKAIRSQFTNYFPAPEKAKKPIGKKTETQQDPKRKNIYQEIIDWFNEGNTVDLLNESSAIDYRRSLDRVPGLKKLVQKLHPGVAADEMYFLMEFVLHGLSEYSLLSKHLLHSGMQFSDLFSSVFTDNPLAGLEEDDEDFTI